VFGAGEAEHYLANGAGIGQSAVPDLVAALQYVWRFPTDPFTRACWARIAGYPIGLALPAAAGGSRYAEAKALPSPT
jgi:hypothetical protein